VRETIFLLALASANSGVALRAVEPMLPRLASDFGESVSATAVIISAYAFAYAGAQLLYGPLGDRFGKLRVVTLSLAGAALASFGCALAEDLATLAAMQFATGLFASTPVMLGMAYIGDRVPAAGRRCRPCPASREWTRTNRSRTASRLAWRGPPRARSRTRPGPHPREKG